VILGNILRVAFQSLGANKMRLVLTMLGMIIGVAAVIAMLALGEGARSAAMKHFEQLGTNLLVMYNHWGRARRQMITLDEWRLIERQTEYVQMCAPAVRRQVPVRYGNENMQTNVLGTTPEYFPVRNTLVETGRIFDRTEVLQAADVCVIGAKVAEDLFKGAEPLHEEIYLADRRVQIIGVTKLRGGQDWYNPDDMVIVPLPTAMRRIVGQDFLDAVHITVPSHDLVAEAEAALTHVVRRHRQLTEEEENNFRIFSQTEILRQVEQQIGIFKALLGGVAAVSLLVGGIGIMNVMLVTVTERTREIGVRKALGARRRDILLQFLIESVVVACVGGALGIGVGFGIATLFRSFSENFDPLITANSIILAVSCSTAIGLIFGIYPARRAARLDPIEALRHE
jgi:putative ABC transport system permease protein